MAGIQSETGNVNPLQHSHVPKALGPGSKFIYIDRLPINSEPSVIHGWLFGCDDKVVDILAPTSGYGCCWVEFETAEDAATAASAYDGYHTGPQGQKISARLLSATENPNNKENVLSYTSFVQKHAAAQPTSTVLIYNLPSSRPIGNVNEMVETLGYETFGYEDDEEHGLFDVRISDYEEGVLANFHSVDDAAHFFHSYDGEYWKNNTLHVEYRPDSDMSGPNRVKSAATKNTKLWVNNTGGVTDEEIRQAFRPVTLNDISRASSKASLIFLDMAGALKLLDEYPEGKRLRSGRKISLREDKKDGPKFASARAARPPTTTTTKETNVSAPPTRQAFRTLPTPTPKTSGVESIIAKTEGLDLGSKETPVKVSNLSEWTSNADVRDLFKNYRLSGKGVSGKKGPVFAWFVSEEDAQRVVAVLNGSRLDGKNIKVDCQRSKDEEMRTFLTMAQHWMPP